MQTRRIFPSRRRQAGQSFIEYIVVTLVAVVALAASLAELGNAIKAFYGDYSFAMSVSAIPNCVFSKDLGGYADMRATVSADLCPEDPLSPMQSIKSINFSISTPAKP